MSTKLHVSHLDLSTGDVELGNLFSRHGVVRRAQVMVHRCAGSDVNTGLVEMDSDEQCAAAIAMLNGQEHHGQTLAVNWASDVDHSIMYESMNTHDEPASEDPRGANPGDFADRGAQGTSAGPPVQGEPAPPRTAAPNMCQWSIFLPAQWPSIPFTTPNAQ